MTAAPRLSGEFFVFTADLIFAVSGEAPGIVCKIRRLIRFG